MIVGIAVETTVVSNDASAVTRTSAAVTALRRFGSNRGALVSRDAMGATAYSTARAGRGRSGGVDFDLDVRGRDRDRAEEGSTALEGVDEALGLLLRDSREIEAKADGVEDGVVGTGGVGAVHLAGDLDSDAGVWEALLL